MDKLCFCRQVKLSRLHKEASSFFDFERAKEAATKEMLTEIFCQIMQEARPGIEYRIEDSGWYQVRQRLGYIIYERTMLAAATKFNNGCKIGDYVWSSGAESDKHDSLITPYGNALKVNYRVNGKNYSFWEVRSTTTETQLTINFDRERLHKLIEKIKANSNNSSRLTGNMFPSLAWKHQQSILEDEVAATVSHVFQIKFDEAMEAIRIYLREHACSLRAFFYQFKAGSIGLSDLKPYLSKCKYKNTDMATSLLHCAVNPTGTCENCTDFEPKQ